MSEKPAACFFFCRVFWIRSASKANFSRKDANNEPRTKIKVIPTLARQNSKKSTMIPLRVVVGLSSSAYISEPRKHCHTRFPTFSWSPFLRWTEYLFRRRSTEPSRKSTFYCRSDKKRKTSGHMSKKHSTSTRNSPDCTLHNRMRRWFDRNNSCTSGRSCSKRWSMSDNKRNFPFLHADSNSSTTTRKSFLQPK